MFLIFYSELTEMASEPRVGVALIKAQTEKVTRSNLVDILSVVHAPIEKHIEARNRLIAQLKTKEKHAHWDKRQAVNDGQMERIRADTLELTQRQPVCKQMDSNTSCEPFKLR